MLHYDTSNYMRSKSISELSSEIREQRGRKKEREFVDDFLGKIKLIMEKNGVKLGFIENDLIQLRAYSLQEKESVNIENSLLQVGPEAIY